MHKELFDDAIGEVPPSTVDVDAVVARGRRAARVRRVANPAVAAGVAVVLLTGVVAYTMTRDDGTGEPVVGAQPATSPSAQPSGPPTSGGPTRTHQPFMPREACEQVTRETPAQVIDRLDPVFTSAVTAQRQDLTFTGRGPYGALKFRMAGSGSLCDTGNYLIALATTHGPQGSGNVQIIVQVSGTDPSTVTCADRSGPDSVCTIVTSQYGDVVRKTTGQLKYDTTGNDVEVYRPDGTFVMVTADNIGSTDSAGGTAPPFTPDQLAAIGTDPGITLFP